MSVVSVVFRAGGEYVLPGKPIDGSVIDIWLEVNRAIAENPNVHIPIYAALRDISDRHRVLIQPFMFASENNDVRDETETGAETERRSESESEREKTSMLLSELFSQWAVVLPLSVEVRQIASESELAADRSLCWRGSLRVMKDLSLPGVEFVVAREEECDESKGSSPTPALWQDCGYALELVGTCARGTIPPHAWSRTAAMMTLRCMTPEMFDPSRAFFDAWCRSTDAAEQCLLLASMPGRLSSRAVTMYAAWVSNADPRAIRVCALRSAESCGLFVQASTMFANVPSALPCHQELWAAMLKSEAPLFSNLRAFQSMISSRHPHEYNTHSMSSDCNRMIMTRSPDPASTACSTERSLRYTGLRGARDSVSTTNGCLDEGSDTAGGAAAATAAAAGSASLVQGDHAAADLAQMMGVWKNSLQAGRITVSYPNQKHENVLGVAKKPREELCFDYELLQTGGLDEQSTANPMASPFLGNISRTRAALRLRSHELTYEEARLMRVHGIEYYTGNPREQRLERSLKEMIVLGTGNEERLSLIAPRRKPAARKQSVAANSAAMSRAAAAAAAGGPVSAAEQRSRGSSLGHESGSKQQQQQQYPGSHRGIPRMGAPVPESHAKSAAEAMREKTVKRNRMVLTREVLRAVEGCVPKSHHMYKQICNRLFKLCLVSLDQRLSTRVLPESEINQLAVSLAFPTAMQFLSYAQLLEFGSPIQQAPIARPRLPNQLGNSSHGMVQPPRQLMFTPSSVNNTPQPHSSVNNTPNAIF